jgi:hypothetical protein
MWFQLHANVIDFNLRSIGESLEKLGKIGAEPLMENNMRRQLCQNIILGREAGSIYCNIGQRSRGYFAVLSKVVRSIFYCIGQRSCCYILLYFGAI